ncbi:MAG: FAD:protein FMN transferase [Desulfobacterales bacterium]
MGLRCRQRSWTIWPVLFLLLLSSAACTSRREVLFEGKTMGTTYHIKVVADYWARTGPVAAAIEARLEAVNDSMSTYRPESEISRFNRLASAGTAFAISEDFNTVMQVARTLHRLTEGAWDGTLDPLVDLWGFGRSEHRPVVPSAEAIQAHLDRVGFDQIDLPKPRTLVKRRPAITLDLASIAKGYGVDAVSGALMELGYTDFLVEIGGEVYASGTRPGGKPWRVGINTPKAEAGFNEVYKAFELTDRAFATSGDYRIFFESNGKHYSHILDPRTGYPVSNGVVSASVAARSCTFADGLATALVVMGAEKGIELVNRLEDVECLIIVQKPDGSLVDHYSKGFQVQ